MRTPSRGRRAALLLPAIAIVLSGCAQQIGGTGPGLHFVNAGKLTTCTHLPYPPFQASEGSEIVGFDVDLINLVAKDLHVTQTFKDTPFEGIKTGENLNQGDCDLAAAGMTITAQRKQVMDFSDPYFEATQALLVHSGSPVTGLAQLRGRTLAVQSGTTGEIYANKNKARYGYAVRQFEDLALLETAVKTSQVDAGINDNGVLYNYAKNNPDTTVVTEFHTGEQYGFAVRKGNTALRQKINTALAKAKRNGEYARIYRKWFGTAPTKG